VLFLIPAFSLAGFPPLSGFWAKLVVVLAAVEVRSWPIVAVALVVGLLTIYSMTKIWQAAFWSPVPEGRRLGPLPSRTLLAPVAVLASITVIIGLWSGPFLALAEASAAELLDPAGYVRAVLGSGAAEALTEVAP
jgi:multicomponent Na+:H+ antiporter subunit D